MKELSLHLLDLAENSTAAHASTIQIQVHDSLSNDRFHFSINDNGCGMSADLLARVTDPYTTTRTTRKVGLGLPLIKMNAEHCDGGISLHSQPGHGTTLLFWFRHSHWDRPPMGDLPGTLVMLITQHPHLHWLITYTTDTGSYTLDSADIINALGGTEPLAELSVHRFLKEMIAENLSAINANQ